MIGVDTNVLVRLLITEDPIQTARAVEFFDERSATDPAFISMLVMAELAWVLRKTYKFDKAPVARVFERFLESSDIAMERADIVSWALERFDHSKIDFADLLIAEINRQAGATKTMTFDQNAAKRIPGMELLA